VASLSLATDLAVGQPLEHGLRRTLLAIWLGEELGLEPEDLSTTYYVALLGSVGCIVDGAVFSEFVQDEISMRADMVLLDPTRHMEVTAFFLRWVGDGDWPLRRLRKLIALSSQQQAVCRDVAMQIGGLLDLGPAIRAALGQCEEHWNGKGPVLGLQGEEIHLAARLFLLCHDAEVFNRVGGTDAAMSVVKERAGRVYDPRMATYFGRLGPALLARLQAVSVWDAALASEPEPVRQLTSSDLDDVARKVANFVDVRCPFTVGHSTAVAALAENAAGKLGLSANEAWTLRLAGLLHDLGRAGVPASAWNKSSALTDAEWQRMQRHPSLSELVLARSASLGHVAALAGLHHERLDGSGYRAMSAASLPLAARILMAADMYQTKLEARPHRASLTPQAAMDVLSKEVETGKLDREAVNAVLTAAGQPPVRRPRSLPAGLSEREAEVLSLAVRGLSNRQIADALVLSPKTVGRHIESIYSKIGVSTRVGATLFAMQHGLATELSSTAAKLG
jgi:HD-GYP domain-containing protein (c-di-GMP phosphodiesterase class II)